MRRLEHEPDAIWHSQALRPVPAGVIELEDDPLVFARARRFGEVRQDSFEHLLANSVRDIPHRGARGRLHEAPDIEPFVTVMAKRDGPFALGRPDPSQDGFQTDLRSSSAPCGSAPLKGLIHHPDFDGGLRMLLFFFSNRVMQFFLALRDPFRPPLWGDAAAVFGWCIRLQRARPSRADRARI